MIVNQFDNILFDKVSNKEFEHLDESNFIAEVLLSLSQRMKAEFDEYLFFILASDNPQVLPSSINYVSEKKKILIWVSDESGALPYHLSQHYHMVFKTHLPTNEIYFTNIFHFSLGCVKDVPQLPILPMSDRSYSVFFSGNLNNRRVKLYLPLLFGITNVSPNFTIRLSFLKKLLVRLKSNFDNRFPNSYIRFTSGFKKGISPMAYGQLIANSKIVICPSGFVSAECFRHYEAMRAGCVVVSEKLPDTYFYKDSPIIQVNTWDEGLRKILELLNDPNEIVRLGQLTQKWWYKKCSEKGTAQFLHSCINKMQNRNSILLSAG